MNIGLDSVFNLGKAALERIWPDPIKRAEEMRKLEELHQKGDLAQLEAHVKGINGQLEIAKAQAAHKSIFVAGARPFIMWVCGVALAYQFLIYPLIMWLWAWQGLSPADAPPSLSMSELMPVLLGMLGLGGMRTYEKQKGVQTDKIKG